MDYKNKHCLVTGSTGFIGSKIVKMLEEEGAIVQKYVSDIRDKENFSKVINYTTDYVFHFGTPSSEILFKRNNRYCVDVTINSFLILLDLCLKNNVKLIYPSTGLLSQNRYNEYARCKKILEDIHFNSIIDALALRIYAGYGDNEGHKRDYASPVFLFAKDMINDKRPILFGNGEQTRDFIFVDDMVKDILILAEECNEKSVEIGSGKSYSFNEIVKIINRITNKNIKPRYVEKPKEYYDNTNCDTTILYKYCPLAQISLEEGIRRIIKHESNCNDND